MRVSEWSDIHVSISAMQLSLPKMSGGGDGGPMVWRTDSDGESAMERERVPPSEFPPLSVAVEGDSLLEGRVSAVRQVFLSLSVVVGRTTGQRGGGGLGGDDDAVARVACLAAARAIPGAATSGPHTCTRSDAYSHARTKG